MPQACVGCGPGFSGEWSKRMSARLSLVDYINVIVAVCEKHLSDNEVLHPGPNSVLRSPWKSAKNTRSTSETPGPRSSQSRSHSLHLYFPKKAQTLPARSAPQRVRVPHTVGDTSSLKTE
jgi:hypothetical protein